MNQYPLSESPRPSSAASYVVAPGLLNIVLALLYCASGYLSLRMTLAPTAIFTSAAIPLFAPAGLAVAGLLLYGRNMLPAVFAGHFLFLSLSSGTDIMPRIDISTLFLHSSFAVVQAWFAWFLVRRVIGWPLVFDNVRTITHFLLLVAPLAPLVGVCAELTQFFLVNPRRLNSDYLFFLWVRWSGDVLGIILYTPLLLMLLSARKRIVSKKDFFKMIMPQLGIIFTSYLVLYNVNHLEALRNTEKIKQEANHISIALSKRFEAQQEVLLILAEFMASRPDMNADVFRNFTTPWLQRHPDTLNLSWNPIIKDQDRQKFEESMELSTGQTDFRILARTSNGDTFPAPQAARYFPIQYVEPLSRNRAVLGLDPSQSAVLNTTLLRAFGNHQPAFSQRLRVIQDLQNGRNDSFGIAIYHPVYSTESRELLGIVSSVIKINEVIAMITGEDKQGLLDVCLMDIDPTQRSNDPDTIKSCGMSNWERSSHQNTTIQELTIGGQRWVLYVHPTALYIKQQQNWILWFSLAVGLIAVIFLEGFLLLLNVHNQRIEKYVHTLTHYDSLTRLPNRSYWHRCAQEWLPRRQPFALLFLDLDHFKTINDGLGHAIGDQMLTAIAERLQQESGSSALLGRHGGDEFVLLVPTGGDINQARRQLSQHAQAVLRHISQPLNFGPHELLPSVSIGIALYPHDGNDLDTLMRHADLAMYAAKTAGRNQFAFFEQNMNERAQERLMLENMLRKAIENNELLLHYQPQFDDITGHADACEALIRWKHPELGFILPSQFIPVAEESGLIVRIGEWVLREACRQQVQWQRMGRAICVAVNISALQFSKPDFNTSVFRILEETGANPSLIELEITETALMHSTDVLLTRLNELRGRGLPLSLDDFGTGYSCLAYLKRLPITRLKLDRSFVKDLPGDAEDAAIASAAVSMATDLGMSIVAEGVETEEQLLFLRERGCRYMQGYLFSPPVAAENLFATLENIEQRYKRPVPRVPANEPTIHFDDD